MLRLVVQSPNQLFGAKVRAIRANKGMSQEDLAHAAGIDRTYMSGIERGVRNPTLTVIVKLANALTVPPHELLNFEQ